MSKQMRCSLHWLSCSVKEKKEVSVRIPLFDRLIYEMLLRLNTFERALQTAQRMGAKKLVEQYQQAIQFILANQNEDALPDSPY